MEVLIIGAGIGGLTLGLMLHRAGIACRIFEAAPELKAVGVGINILPHASRELCALGLEDALAKVAVTTREYCFYNRFGQFIYSEPAGRFARNFLFTAATSRWFCSTLLSRAPVRTRS
jgi:2-polyprenyl-6-methoxyphenol hydroxylase-like FAD-dependent oxidoreductase